MVEFQPLLAVGSVRACDPRDGRAVSQTCSVRFRLKKEGQNVLRMNLRGSCGTHAVAKQQSKGFFRFGGEFAMQPRLLTLWGTLFMSLMSQAYLVAAEQPIPSALENWRSWVLRDVSDAASPSPYDDASTRLPLWPAVLRLDIEAAAATWELSVQAFDETWLPIPGDADTWPEAVELDGQLVPVVGRDSIPSIRLTAGLHTVRGQFTWREPPERIAIPSTIGVLGLRRNGETVRFPDRDATGVLWLRRTSSAQEEQDQVSVQVYRVLEDGLPIWLRTELELSVSGKSREENLGCVIPTGWQVAVADGPIPVALDAGGRLRAQVRAGTWRIRIDAFRTEDTREIAYASENQPTVASELIALQSRPELRATEFANATAVDVNLTTFPERWRSLPVFRWDTSAPLRWAVKDPGAGLQQPDRFRISRRLWLDEDGNGITFEDTIEGKCQAISRLDAAEGHQLEVVRIDGERQLITRNPDSNASGIELRTARPRIQAIGRTERSATLPALGWRSDADGLDVRFALPPGWRMLAVFGADRVDGDWLTAWTLLDLFLLLVFSIGLFRMRGIGPAAIAFLAFGLTYHEAGSPRFTWLFLLAPIALLQVTESPRAVRWLGGWKLLALGVLLLHLVPFVMNELQSALYPQLEAAGIHYRQRGLAGVLGLEANRVERSNTSPSRLRVDVPQPKLPELDSAKNYFKRGVEQQVAGAQLQMSNLAFAPGTQTQTGIARPAWDGNQVICRWDGPVSSQQTLRTILLPAWVHRLLVVVRVGLLVLLLREMLRQHAGKDRSSYWSRKTFAIVMLLVGLSSLSCAARPAAAQDFPPSELLDQLRSELLQPAVAFPHAAEISTAVITLTDERVRVEAQVHAAAECGIPVPGRLPSWSPLSVKIDGEAATICRRADGYLWVWLPIGVHSLVVEGLIPDTSEWVWNCQLVPRRMSVNAPGWNVRGIRADGRPEGPLFFSRREGVASADAAYDQKLYRSVVQVDRVVEIGLVWKVHTKVRRLTPPGKAVTLTVPLLEGERVLTGAGDGPDGSIQVVLPADGASFSWESELPITPSLRLEAGAEQAWVERWSLVPSPVWNVQATDLSAIYEADAEALIPIWQPWPGESVTFSFERPAAVEGRTLTIQSASRQVEIGRRRRTTSLSLEVESSLGGEFPIALAEEAKVTAVRLNDGPLPIRRENDQLVIGLHPGRQKLVVEWAVDEPLPLQAAFDPIGLPIEAANLTSTMQVPVSRWILWSQGPLRGPAVRFWAILAVAIVLGIGLGRIPHSPLVTTEWLLLLIGLTQVSVFAGALVVAWLFILGTRGRLSLITCHWFLFDFMQLMLIGLTIAALITLVVVVNRGLLGSPEMFIVGNGSSGSRLVWFAPQTTNTLGRPWVLTVSIWWYRLLMLLWGLWLANAVTRWLAMGWRHFTKGGGWRWWGRVNDEKVS